MQYDVTSPEAYLEVLEDDWRKEKVMQLRQVILNAADDIEEIINYKMLAYQDNKGIICHLNAQKQYVAMYVGDTKKIDIDGTLLQGINCGKGCVRFKKSNDVLSPNITAFVLKAVQLWKDGVDLGC